jgi:uncharacterized membrane protein YjjP (DUF1212 family)
MTNKRLTADLSLLAVALVFAALFAYLWIGELTSLAITGFLLIFLGMLLTELPQFF